MLTEINRVLNAGGVYIVISYGQPDQRLLYLDKVIILFNSFFLHIIGGNLPIA